MIERVSSTLISLHYESFQLFTSNELGFPYIFSSNCCSHDAYWFCSIENCFRDKKSFRWKFINENLPSFAETVAREQFQHSFNDWVKYAPITFQEVTQNEKADFELAFTDSTNDSKFDGPGGKLAYAYFPPVGKIRFDAAEDWTHK